MNWKQFLALPEVGVPLNTAEYKIDIYLKYIKELKLLPEELKGIHTRKLHRAIPFVSKSNFKEIKDKAERLSFNDFISEVTGQEQHWHEPENKTIKVCKICHKAIK